MAADYRLSEWVESYTAELYSWAYHKVSYSELAKDLVQDTFLAAAEKLQMLPEETIIFEDSIAGIEAAERAGAGKIYIVNSYGENYSRFAYDIITDFSMVNRTLFG